MKEVRRLKKKTTVKASARVAGEFAMEQEIYDLKDQLKGALAETKELQQELADFNKASAAPPPEPAVEEPVVEEPEVQVEEPSVAEEEIEPEVNGSALDNPWGELTPSSLKRKTVKDLSAYLEERVSEMYHNSNGWFELT